MLFSPYHREWSTDDYNKTARQILGHTAFWDEDLTEIPGLVKKVATYLQQID